MKGPDVSHNALDIIESRRTLSMSVRYRGAGAEEALVLETVAALEHVDMLLNDVCSEGSRVVESRLSDDLTAG